MAQIKNLKTPYTKTGDVLTFKFRVPGFSQDAINALVLELLAQLEGSDDHPTAYLVEASTAPDDAHLFAEREAFVAEQERDEDDEIADVSDEQANEALVRALPAYNGWKAAWEYPGYLAFHRTGSDSVFATPDHNTRGEIAIDVQYPDGRSTSRPNIAWSRKGRTPEGFLALLAPVLDSIAPRQAWVEVGYGLSSKLDTSGWEIVGFCSHGHPMRRDPANPDNAVDLGCDAELHVVIPDVTPVVVPDAPAPVESDEIFEAVMAAMQRAEELGGPEGAQYVALMERIAHEAQGRANRYRERLADSEPGKVPDRAFAWRFGGAS